MSSLLGAALRAAAAGRDLLTNLVERTEADRDASNDPTIPIAPPDSDETPIPPEPFDHNAAIRITRPAYRAAMDYLTSRPPEAAGALLGKKGSDLVSRFVPDTWGQANPASFTFGTNELNERVRPFIDRGEEILGLIHSHPSGCPTPSSGDRAYLDRLFQNPKNTALQWFLFPIVEDGVLRPYIALRSGPGGSMCFVHARLDIVESRRTRYLRRPAPALDTTRIRSLIDVQRMATLTATLVGCGGGANLARNLTRCNLGRINVVDHDRIEALNIARQEHPIDKVGRFKVDALRKELHRINPAMHVRTYARDFCDFTDREIDRLFADTNLFIFAVDNLPANARGNEVALRLGKPAIWSGLYAGGRAGEVVWWKPGLPCYRCLCSTRYAARDRGEDVSQPAESADIFAVQYLDAVAGMIALGLLTEGADNGYGRLIAQLGDRNFLQLKISPEWSWHGRDVIREHLGIADDCPAYVSWCSIARSDPAGGLPPCPDCRAYRGAR